MTDLLAAGDLVLAHHPLLVAVPFFVPAVIVAAVVGGVVVRDRRTPDDPAESGDDRSGA